MNGFACLIGKYTGLPLDYITFNRMCSQCETDKNNGTVTKHECRLNFFGTAKAMEAEGAVKLVTQSKILQDADVEVGVFAADNDSSSKSALQKACSYPIIFQSDMNHTTKGVSNILYEVKSNRGKDPDQELDHDSIKYLKKCFTYAVKQNLGDIEGMKAAIKNIPHHVNNEHSNCGSWCQGKSEKENYNVGIDLKNEKLIAELHEIYSKLSKNASKFLLGTSSQANESINNTMASKSSKRLCYSKSESADYRFACSIAQKIFGESYIMAVLEKQGFSWSSDLEHHVERTTKVFKRRKEKQSTPEEKKKRIKRAQTRSQLKNRKEAVEENTYRSNMSLFDKPQEVSQEQQVCQYQRGQNQQAQNQPGSDQENQNHQNCQEVSSSIPPALKDNDYLSKEFHIIFFDMETGGLNMSKYDILQIAMKVAEADSTFSSYITPRRMIHSKAAEITGLTKTGNKLYKNGNEVRRGSFKKYSLIFGKIG